MDKIKTKVLPTQNVQLSQNALRTKELEESVDREKYEKEKKESNVGELNELVVTLQLQLQVKLTDSVACF